MKYYVIINGESSLDIQGLAIESLPAISKPLMRSKREEIDGRNGDIITQLGFSAYDKTLKIGLWGNYDIDEIISYFNQDGIITFSNEPDMYYNFTILNRIDFINQLEAFRKATITIHCQPFKYKEEETEELEIITKEVSGTDISVNDSYSGTMDIVLNGNTYQTYLSGINILNCQDYPSLSTGVTVDSNDYATATYNNTSGSEDFYLHAPFRKTAQMQPSTNYLIVCEIKSVSGTGFLYPWTQHAQSCIDTFHSSYSFTSLSAGQIIVSNVKTKSDISSITNALRTLVRFNAGQSGTIVFRLSLLTDLTITPTTFVYQKYVGGVPSPNPSYPQDINVVSGNNSVVVCGKNFVGLSNFISITSDSGITLTNDATTGKITLNGTTTKTTFINYGTRIFKPNEIVSISANNSSTTGRVSIRLYNIATGNPTSLIELNNVNTISENIELTDTYDCFQIRIASGTTLTNFDLYPQVELGANATTFELYQSQTYPINLGSIELCKIGDYIDYFYKQDDKWYLHKEVGKYVFASNENWSSFSYGTNSWMLSGVMSTTFNANEILSLTPKFQGIAQADRNDNYAQTYFESNGTQITIRNTTFTTKELAQSGMYGQPYYYVLATPTNTEITDTTLKEQLEAIKEAQSYLGTTNINQVNNDMPFILDVSYLSGTNEITITNNGNYYSKPKLTIAGTGNIGIYLNDNQIFQVALGTNETIIIDTDKMEAYYESTLKNRQVIGDYNNFKLIAGENKIKLTGNWDKLSVDNYSRWI